MSLVPLVSLMSFLSFGHGDVHEKQLINVYQLKTNLLCVKINKAIYTNLIGLFFAWIRRGISSTPPWNI